MKKAFILFITLLPIVAFAQVTVKGRILNQADTKPVANASVFLSNATIGDKTGADGTFTLQNVKPGKYDLVISIVGFEAETRPITVSNADISIADIAIFPKTTSLKEVTVKVNRDPDRQRNFDWFKDEFLGTSGMAKECKILNPEMLDLSYDYKTGTLTASSVDFLVIRNNALGYKLQYLLSNFTLNNSDPADKSFSFAGSVLFEELEGSPSQKKQWQAMRQQVYEGSQMHFLQSALHDRLDQDGFRIQRLPLNIDRPADSLIASKIKMFTLLKGDDKKFRDSLSYWEKKYRLPKFQQKLSPFPLTVQDVVNLSSQKGIYALGCSYDAMYVTYNKYHRFGKNLPERLSDPSNTDNTLVIFNEPTVFFDNNGTIINPASLTYDGVWLRGRIAGLLPLNYEPQQNGDFIAGETVLQNLSAKLTTYTAANITEKAYLHFDKPYYAAGDTIYFKTYVTQGAQHTPSAISKVLYVDLVNGQNKITRSLALNLNEGLAWGDIALPDTLKQGNYYIRAYTNYLRNAGEAYFFEKLVPVANSPVVPKAVSAKTKKAAVQPAQAALPTQPVVNEYDIQFFPEGGNLLVGNRSAITFKAVTSNGLGVAVTGVIRDNNGKDVTKFNTTHAGMGLIYLTPEAGITYNADVSYPDGSTRAVYFPKAESTGYSMAIDNTGDKELKLIVKAGGGMPKQMSIVAQAGGVICYTANINADNKPVSISKDKLPTGIVQFTLFSASGEPANERLVFIHNHDNLKVALASAQQKYTPRQPVKIDISATNSSNAPVAGSFSIAVIDETKVQVNEQGEITILSNLLLTSDLKGYVENPNYYFLNDNKDTRANLDLLMLTQGYRRFMWKQVLNNSYPANAWQPQKGISLSGLITDMSGKAVPNAKVSLLTKNARLTLSDTIADAQGRFVFGNLNFIDTSSVILQAHKPDGGRNVKIVVDSIPPNFAYNIPGLTDTSNLAGYLANSKRLRDEKARYRFNKTVITLNAVTIKDKRVVKEGLEDSQNLNGKGNADQSLTSKELESTALTNLYQVLRSRVSGVEFTGKDVYSRRSIGDFKNERKAMAVVVDGMLMEAPADKVSYLTEMSTFDVQSVEVLLGTKGSAVYGPAAAGGAFIISTKKAKVTKYEKYAPGVLNYKAVGYYKAREFYSPHYDDPKINQSIPDLRSTIYWNPNVLTDENGKAVVAYFNADSPGTYRVVIEGIDADGNLGRQVYRYKVQ